MIRIIIKESPFIQDILGPLRLIFNPENICYNPCAYLLDTDSVPGNVEVPENAKMCKTQKFPILQILPYKKNRINK